MIELYTLLFTDTLFANLVVSTSKEVVLESMHTFGYYDGRVVSVLVSSAWLFSVGINYFFGRVLHNILRIESVNFINRTEKVMTVINRDPIFVYTLLGLLSITPNVGKFVPLFAGFVKSDFRPVAISSFLMKSLYYLWLIFC